MVYVLAQVQRPENQLKLSGWRGFLLLSVFVQFRPSTDGLQATQVMKGSLHNR